MKTKILLPVFIANIVFTAFAYTQDTIPSVMFGEDTILYIYPYNNATEVDWGGYGTLINANYSNGAINTALIVQELGDNNGVPYAAKICDTLSAYGYDDWYLPSSWELWEICDNISSVLIYESWSSNEISNTEAWWYSWAGGCSLSGEDKNIKTSCRCIRREYINTSSNSENIIKKLKLIPDPANNVVNISIKGLTGKYEMTVYNIQGNTLQSRKINVSANGYSGKIDVSGYAKGTYIVRIKNGKAVSTTKFVL